jgi:hypothetical protein
MSALPKHNDDDDDDAMISDEQHLDTNWVYPIAHLISSDGERVSRS